MLEQALAGSSRFFRVKLAGADAALPHDRGGIAAAEAGAGGARFGVAGMGRIGMHEIHPGLRIVWMQHRAGMESLQTGPAHVGDALASILRQPGDMATQQAEPGALAFLAAVKKQLQTEADAQ